MENISIPASIQDVCIYIENHGCKKDLSLKKTIENRFNHNYESFRKKFRNHNKCSIREFHNRVLLKRAVELLRTSNKIYVISLELNFCDDSHFIYWFRKKTGYTPSQYKGILTDSEKEYMEETKYSY